MRGVRREAGGAGHVGSEKGMTMAGGRQDVGGRLKGCAEVSRSRVAGIAPPLESVDLRYSDGFSVRFKPPSDPDRKVMDLCARNRTSG